MNRIAKRIIKQMHTAKIRTDDKLKPMKAHDAFEYKIGDSRNFYVTFYLDPIDQVGTVMIKLEDNKGDVIDACEIWIPQEVNEALRINHDKSIVFSGSKEEKALIREKNSI